MVTHRPKHILIAPLDWGLGHTTRCIPVIKHIQDAGHVPIVAGNAAQLSFINQSVAGVETVALEGYNVRYSKWNKWAQVGLLAQLPRISGVIKKEYEWLQQLCTERHIDGIISDNRYGLHHKNIPSVILTHQLQVLTGMGSVANRTVQLMHYKYINRFDAVWVPDMPGKDNLSGKLGHTTHLPEHTTYIGLLSRFDVMRQPFAEQGDLLILLSGPEPLRGELAERLWQEAMQHKGKVVFVAGSETTAMPEAMPEHITYHKRLAGDALEQALRGASMVLCRSGYSTLMDLCALGKKAIVIPTPGQTEQEYLGAQLHQQGIAYCMPQQKFVLQTALHDARSFPFHSYPDTLSFDLYRPVLDKWLNSL